MDCYCTAIYFKFIEAGYDAFIDYANKMHFLLNISSLISSKDFFSLDSKQYFFGNRSSVSRSRWSQSNPAIVIDCHDQGFHGKNKKYLISIKYGKQTFKGVLFTAFAS